MLTRRGPSHLAQAIGRREEILPEILDYLQTHYALRERTEQAAIYALPGIGEDDNFKY